MNSPRWRAGTRRNKYTPVARQTCASDRQTERHADEYAGWYEAYLYASKPGLGRLALALGALHRDAAQGSKPSHPFRAVDIDACFGARLPERDSAKAAAARRAGDCGRFAAPMTMLARAARYERQRGVLWVATLTPAQRRRLKKKARSVGELV